ncbi:MAG TPA: transglutaminaseTgpA domain-containing protein [Candidatus Acidoferrum sp.]|nr:transglutaminaseTgpA domain-containing protein [Candidatus Acidoferrum sp.]
MPQSVPEFDVIPLSQAINKYFDLSMYLLVLTGFGTLASTGILDWPAIILVGTALAVRGYLLAERRRIVFSERWTTPLTIAYFVFYAVDYFLLSRSFLTATVHLVLFAVVVRTFSLRRDRDYTTLAILAFLMVLASAVLTVDSAFLLFFAGFTVTAVATFVLMEMRRSGKMARFQARHSRDEHEHRHLAFSLARITPALVLMILAGAAAVFFLLPRMSVGYLGGHSFGTDLSTGFSDRVQLGQIGQIQQSDAVVMHIQIEGDQQGQYALHWRGVALADFDGKSWSNPQATYVLRRQSEGGFAIPYFSQGLAEPAVAQTLRASGGGAHLIHYRVLMEPIGTNVFFLAPWARRVNGTYRAVEIDTGGAVSDVDAQHPVSIYEADSDISSPAAADLRQATGNPPQFSFSYLKVPALDPRIPQLAVQITASASDNYDKAAALEKYLQSHYGYTLQLQRAPLNDPLSNFLFVRKQGHCEYFASSMAVMLRTLGIPSRVVNGFRSDEFNDLTANYVVRARNAHSWVEAYFPGYGWVTFDPTPGGSVGSPQGWGRAMLYLDAAASFWREWVVSYDSTHQYMLGQSMLSGTRRSWEGARRWAQLRYARLMSLARKSQRAVEHSPKRWLGVSVAVVLLLLLLTNAGRIAHMIRTRQLQTHPERSPDMAAVMWYERMARYLARRGVRKSSSQTAQEFVRVIEDSRLRARVGKFTDAYESARFGDSAEDAIRLPELYEEVEAATKK